MAAGGPKIHYVIEHGDELLVYCLGGQINGFETDAGVATLAGVKLPVFQTTLGKTSVVYAFGDVALKVPGLNDENLAFLLERFPLSAKTTGKS